MLTHPNFDPVALDLGGLRVHWYGLMYLLAFLMGWVLGTWRTRDSFRGWTRHDMDDVMIYVALGIIVGGRVGYVIFYVPGQFLDSPSVLFQVWQGGMSFHGGLLGTMAAMWLFARRRQWHFFKVADFIAPLVPLGLGAGRIGNFINGNLWGKPSEVPWAMVFPSPEAGPVSRHPSQLYEAILEGLVLFLILWLFSRRPRPLMAVSGLFLLGYGVFRFLVEYVRVPDAHIGYLAFDWFTMGHLLTLPMLAAGTVLIWWGYNKHQAPVFVERTKDGFGIEVEASRPAEVETDTDQEDQAASRKNARNRKRRMSGRGKRRR